MSFIDNNGRSVSSAKRRFNSARISAGGVVSAKAFGDLPASIVMPAATAPVAATAAISTAASQI
jgi:hypothetical protein